MLGCIADLDLFYILPGFGGFEDLVKRPLCVGIQIITDQNDFLTIGVSVVYYVGNLLNPVDFRSPGSGVRRSPASFWFSEEKNAGGSSSFIFVVKPLWMVSCRSNGLILVP